MAFRVRRPHDRWSERSSAPVRVDGRSRRVRIGVCPNERRRSASCGPDRRDCPPHAGLPSGPSRRESVELPLVVGRQPSGALPPLAHAREAGQDAGVSSTPPLRFKTAMSTAGCAHSLRDCSPKNTGCEYGHFTESLISLMSEPYMLGCDSFWVPRVGRPIKNN